MTQNTDYVIETHGLSKAFGSVHALRGVDLRVPRHSIFGFLGPNGAGKTSTMKILLGLARPTSGSGTIFGRDIVRESVAIRERIGYLPQQPRFIDYMTARENLEFAAKFFFRGPLAKIRARCDEMLELVGLADKADRPTRGFSGGEKQRLGIALAQVNYPDLLILDEPASALDPLGRQAVLDIADEVIAAGGPVAYGIQIGISIFFRVGSVALALGAIVLSQDLLLDEHQSGVTEWLLAKPVARRAYLLAKLAASSLAILVLPVALPSLVMYLLLSIRVGAPYPWLPFLKGIAVLAVHTLFYLNLTLMLGAFFKSRTPILAIGLVSAVGGMGIGGIFRPLLSVTPWILGSSTELLVMGQTVPSEMMLYPLTATILWCLIFVAAALMRFEKVEF